MTLKDLIENSRPIISELSLRTYLSNLRKVGIDEESDLPKLTKTFDVIKQIENLKKNYYETKCAFGSSSSS